MNKSKNKSKHKSKSTGQMNISVSCNSDNKLYESNVNSNKINEDNFVTITQKDELTSQLHNGMGFFLINHEPSSYL